eukprot:jgi/Psemu1/2429/gm1.2429_g
MRVINQPCSNGKSILVRKHSTKKNINKKSEKMSFVNNKNKNSNSNNSNSSSSNNNSNKQKKRKSVRFHKDVVVLQSIASSSPHAAWLSHYDYQSILKDVLEILKPKDLRTTENSPGCCTRGLESYSTTTTTTTTTTRIEDGLSNKADVILRRRDRIRVVVEEQQLQRREAAAGGQEGKPRCYNDFKMRDACLTHSNRLNGLRAVETSLRDSEAALAIYTGEE